MAQELSTLTNIINSVELNASTLFSDGNLKAYYRLENTTDSGPSGHTLTNNGSVAFNPGKFSNAADFGSSNTTKTLSVGNHADFNFGSGDFSIGCWFKLNTLGVFQGLLAKIDTDTNGYRLDVDSTNKLGAYLTNNVTADNITGITTLTTGVWYHVVLTRGGGHDILYLNGMVEADSTFTAQNLDNTGQPFSIGAYRSNALTSNLIQGLIDDAFVFNRKLTQTEIWSLYKEPLAYFKLENANDSGAYGNTLTASGTVNFSAAKFSNGADFGNPNTTPSFLKATASDLHIAGNVSFSMSIWAKIQAEPAANTTHEIIKHVSTVGADRYLRILYRDVSGTKKLTIDSSGTLTDYNVTLGTTDFHNLIVVRDNANSKVQLYLDGSHVITDATLGSGTYGAKRFNIGADEDGTYLGTSMIGDDVGIFGRVLTSTEVTTIAIGSIAYAATYNETITPSDTFTRSFTKTPSETITLSEIFTRAITRTLSEAVITMTESFSALSSKALMFLETISITETLSRVYQRSFSDTVTLIEIFIKNHGFPIVFSDVMTMKDSLWRWARNQVSRFTREEPKI